MHQVDIYRDNIFLYGIKPESDSSHFKKIMGENELRLSFVHNDYIAFKIGDKAFVFDEWFYINIMPVVTKAKTPGQDYSYQLVMQSTNHVLSRVQYLFLGDDNSLKEGEFSLTGTARDFLDLIVENSKRLMPEFKYEVFDCIDDGYRTLTFSIVNCLDALAKIAEAFDTEYWVDGLYISLIKKGRETGYEFRHGRQKGLYEVIRQTVDNQQVVTRLYAFGSDKNLPEGYRNYSKRLKLPIQSIKTVHNITISVVNNGDGTQTVTFNFDAPDIPGLVMIQILTREVGSTGGFFGAQNGSAVLTTRDYITPVGNYEFIFRSLTTSGSYISGVVKLTDAQPALPFTGEVIYLEKNIDLYGVNEATVIMEEVYPHRTGTVSSVNGADPFEFSDVGMDFDVNDYLLPGATAKVTFNTGQLSGYTFDISSYDNALKKFIILKNKNERAIEVPSVDFRPAIGDKYVIIDIKMPQVYIDNAEAELQTKAQALLDTLSEPQLAYQLNFDPVYLKTKGYKLSIGDLIWIIDQPLQVQRKMRIISINRNIINEYAYQVEIADILREGKLQALTTGQGALNDSVSNISKNIQNNSILNNRVIGNFYISGGTLVIEGLTTGAGLTALGIDADGKIYKM